jgi:hypothetical protein
MFINIIIFKYQEGRDRTENVLSHRNDTPSDNQSASIILDRFQQRPNHNNEFMMLMSIGLN